MLRLEAVRVLRPERTVSLKTTYKLSELRLKCACLPLRLNINNVVCEDVLVPFLIHTLLAFYLQLMVIMSCRLQSALENN